MMNKSQISRYCLPFKGLKHKTFFCPAVLLTVFAVLYVFLAFSPVYAQDKNINEKDKFKAHLDKIKENDIKARSSGAGEYIKSLSDTDYLQLLEEMEQAGEIEAPVKAVFDPELASRFDKEDNKKAFTAAVRNKSKSAAFRCHLIVNMAKSHIKNIRNEKGLTAVKKRDIKDSIKTFRDIAVDDNEDKNTRLASLDQLAGLAGAASVNPDSRDIIDEIKAADFEEIVLNGADDPGVRGYACRVLGLIGGQSALETVKGVLQNHAAENDFTVRSALLAVAGQKNEKDIDILASVLRGSGAQEVRGTAAYAISLYQSESILSPLVDEYTVRPSNDLQYTFIRNAGLIAGFIDSDNLSKSAIMYSMDAAGIINRRELTDKLTKYLSGGYSLPVRIKAAGILYGAGTDKALIEAIALLDGSGNETLEKIRGDMLLKINRTKLQGSGSGEPVILK